MAKDRPLNSVSRPTSLSRIHTLTMEGLNTYGTARCPSGLIRCPQKRMSRVQLPASNPSAFVEELPKGSLVHSDAYYSTFGKEVLVFLLKYLPYQCHVWEFSDPTQIF